MKLDSESPYQHTHPLHDNETKIIVHCDNPFILAKDNHFMIDMLNTNNESPEEGKHDHKSHFERKSSKITYPPKQYLSIEDTLNINKSDYECVNPLYSAPASGFEMVQEDFYTDQIVAKAEFPKVRVCIEDDPCHIVRDISIDEGLHFSLKSLVDKEEVRPIESSISNRTLENGTYYKRVAENEQMGPIKSFISNKTINNEHVDSKSIMEGSAGLDVKRGQTDPTSVLYTASDKKGSSVVTENLLDPASVIHDYYDGKESQASSVNSEFNLETTKSVACSASSKVIENQAVPGSVFHNDCDTKASYVSSIDSENKLGSYESVVSNAHGKGYSASDKKGSSVVTENLLDPASVTHDDYDGKESQASSVNSEFNLETTKSVACSASTKVIENQADSGSVLSGSVFHNDYDTKASYVSSIDSENKLGSYESVESNAHGKGYSLSSLNSEGVLNTTTSVATKYRVVSVSDDHNDFDGDGSHVSSVCIADKVDIDESVERNVSWKLSSVSSISSEDCLDINLVVTNISAEVIENQAVPISGVHNDWEGRESYNNSVDSQDKQDTDKSVASIVSAEVVENQMPPSQEITAYLSNVNSSSHTCSNDEKQSVDGQRFQTISEETNSACPALNFPSEVSAFSNGSKESSSKIKVPSGVITFSFDTEEASVSGRDENIETTNDQKSEVSQNSLGIAEATIDDSSASIRCSSLRFIQEESNLHGPALLSGHYGNSGSIRYSGSVSLRSESSTTSTRSFAFPILPSEWNSSPVKMAKANRRHKHRGWKTGLMCCRF